MLLMLGFSMLTGCPTDAPTDAAMPPVGGDPGMGGAGGGTPPPGDPGAGGGAPGGDAASMGPASLNVTPGEGVKLSGTMEYAGTVTGSTRIDLLSKEGRLVHVMTLDAVGPWEVEVPKDYGEIKVSAFIDTDGNGPSTYEPAGEATATIGQEPVAGVVVKLTDGTGSAPPSDASAGATETTPPPAGGDGKAPSGEAGKAPQ